MNKGIPTKSIWAVRLLMLTVALSLQGICARADSMTEEQAKAKALSFLQKRHPEATGRRLAAARMDKELAGVSIEGHALYVFNVGNQNGFIIVAGDDRARSILGYTDSGTFDANNIPAGLSEMLAIYARQIKSLTQTSSVGLAQADSTAGRSGAKRAMRRISSRMTDVAPLLTTTWNQFGPYNDYCPTLDEATALTGCVATAMAQIAYYYKYPTGQVPSLPAYISSTNKINVSAWGTTTFDWANMLDSYDGSETDAQKAAVATLMRYCGQAAQMDYGFTSGAYNGDALYAFKEKLGYQSDAEFKRFDFYSADGWEDLIYREVSEGRPVYYSALNGDVGCDVEGHAFVIDGYQSDGNFFHVNWGWGGGANGYFNLFALDPGAPESPVTSTGWHYQMMALIGLSPEAVSTTNLIKDADDNWLITSADDWNELSTNIGAYNGGKFKLTSDISVTTMVGTEWQPFSGTFDGQGHTLNVNIEGSGQGVAPFRYVDPGTTIKSLKVTGTVTSTAYHASGLIGMAYRNWNFPVTVNGCEVAVTVNGSNYAGGFIGHSYNMQPVFTDCIFSGSINGCNEHGCFVGWKEHTSRPVYVNCLSIPTSFDRNSSYDFSHPGNGGSVDHATLTNCYSCYDNGFRLKQGNAASSDMLADGSIACVLQSGTRDWTTGQVWGQRIGTDAVPMLSADSDRAVYQVVFTVGGLVVKTIVTNGALGDKMPMSELFGLTNATFTSNGTTFTSTTPITSDITVTVTGTAAYTLTLGTTTNGSIAINNNTCIPGMVKKVTATPANGYVVSAITVTDATGKALPVTRVSNATNEYVFVFPMSSVTVDATFTAGEPESTQFINGGLMLPLGESQPWTADTWTIWSHEYSPTIGTPPVDALGHNWYDENYMLTNSDADEQPNGNKIVWENHVAPFGRGRNYDYGKACGAGNDTPNNFYMRRVFTVNSEKLPTKLYLRCKFDDAPVEIYLNGTLVYKNSNQNADSYTAQLSPGQIALIHSDGTPNVLAARGSQGGGDYFLDCALYDPTAFSYEVTGENSVRVLRNEFITGDVVIPETVTYNGVTYNVTELADDVFNEIYYGMTSVSLPPTVTNVGNNTFWGGCYDNKYIKSYVPIYQPQTMRLLAAPAAATEFELPIGYTGIWDYAFRFTENLKTLTLPRSLNEICENVFIGCTALTDIYSYARPVPATQGNAFAGLDKSKITVHVYASALDSYKQSWGEAFNYVTIPDPTPITLTVNMASAGGLKAAIEEAAAAKESTIYDVVGITVTGTINNDDLCTLADLCTGTGSLATIDLSGASIDGNYIGDERFRDREKLTSIKLPETLEYLNTGVFRNCDGLTTIDIPASVKRIWSYAFYDCSNLTTVTGMEGLSASDMWGAWDVFTNTAITQPVYGCTVFLYMPPSITGEYEMPAGIKTTAADAMRNASISAITLPASLIDLGDDTFRDCKSLTDIYSYASTPPVCHSGVWEYGFDRSACTVHVPASVVEDYQNANEWRDMGRIVGIVAPGSLVDMTLNVTTAGALDDALFNAAVADANISDKVLIKNLTVTGNINADDVAYLNALPSTLYYLELLDISGATLDGNTVTERMFYSTLYKSIKLPANVTSIGYEAFCGSRHLQNITLPTALKTIGESAFMSCGLTSITIPDGVTDMGDFGVQASSSLTSITIGNGLTTIPGFWAEHCTKLESVTIGKQVSYIGCRTFRNCDIKHFYSYAKIPPSCDNEAFVDGGINSTAVLHVYANCVQRYKNADKWKEFHTIIGDLGTYPTYNVTVNVATTGSFSEALPAAMTTAGCEDKMDISKLTLTGNINHDDLAYIRNYLGAYLDTLDLGATTVDGNYFGDDVLAGCGFEELILPANLQEINGWSVLANCNNLKTIDIPSSVRRIAPRFLNRATSLETVTGGVGVTDMDGENGMYFDACPNLKSPVILGDIFFRLPLSLVGAYEVPEGVTKIARDGMWGVTGLTALTLPESIKYIYGNAFSNNVNLKDIYCYTVEVPYVDDWTFNEFDRASCTLHVYEEMAEVFQANDTWSKFRIVGDLGTMPIRTPMNEADYADLCAIYNTLNGAGWTTKWLVNANVQTASRWRGVTFDADGYVTAIDLRNNQLSGDITSLTFTGLTKLTTLNLSENAITGDIRPLAATLPKGCKLNVERQRLGYIGEHTLYEVCRLTEGLPAIAFYNSNSGTLASTLIGVDGVCQFYHAGTDGGHYWDCYIEADGRTTNNFKFYWPSPATVECFYPHHFTFTYNYQMGDANMDDALNVLDLQATLNCSNGHNWGLFNFYAADTYGPDDDINVQDIVTTVNILLALDNDDLASARSSFEEEGTKSVEYEARLSVEAGQIVLYTTKPVAAIDLRLTGIMPESLNWNIEDMGFATATTAQRDGTHAIIYSMRPLQIAEGRTVLATFDTGLSPQLKSAVLSDSEARSITVGNAVPTDIKIIENGELTIDHGAGALYDLQGRKVNDKQRKGLYIENGKKVVY